MRLGWRWPRVTFEGPDQRALRDTFQQLQQNLTWPHVQLGVSSNFNVTSGGTVTVSWTSETDDPYQLHQGTGTDIQVPRDFDTWMCVGAATMASDFGGGAGMRRLEWLLNGAATQARQAAHFSAVGVRLSAPIFLPVSKNDVLALNVINSSGGTDSTSATATLYFLPMT